MVTTINHAKTIFAMLVIFLLLIFELTIFVASSKPLLTNLFVVAFFPGSKFFLSVSNLLPSLGGRYKVSKMSHGLSEGFYPRQA